MFIYIIILLNYKSIRGIYLNLRTMPPIIQMIKINISIKIIHHSREF